LRIEDDNYLLHRCKIVRSDFISGIETGGSFRKKEFRQNKVKPKQEKSVFLISESELIINKFFKSNKDLKIIFE